MDDPRTINEEAGLGDNWVAVDAKPITPSTMPRPESLANDPQRFLQGSIPPAFQLSPFFVDTEGKTAHSPSFSLMPLGVNGNPVSNAAVSSTTTIVVPSGGGGGGTDTDYYQTVEASAVAFTQRPSLNFVGFDVTDNSVNLSTDIRAHGELQAPAEFTLIDQLVTFPAPFVLAWSTQSANLFFRGPITGAAAVPTFDFIYNDDFGGAGTAGQVLTTDGVSGHKPTWGSLPNFADQETPSGSLPGTSFTLAHTPNPAASLQLFWNGQLLKGGGADYTLSGANITTVSTIGAGDDLLAWYRY